MAIIISDRQWDKKTKANKFKAEAQRYKGMFFPSKRELKRYRFLEVLLERGEIGDLRRQVPYKFHLNGTLMFTYRADFVYKQGGEDVVEDAKGVITPYYKIKKKIIETFYGIKINEV